MATPDYVNLAILMRRSFDGNLKISERKQLEKYPEKDTEL